MSKQTQTDNAHLGAKLLLRRYYLDKYHKDQQPLVFDACQAEAVIWTRLRSEYSVRYFGVDRKPKRGRIAIDSARLLETGPIVYDVIDIDTYGSPWRHWMNLLPNIRKPTTVFLTMGAVSVAGGTDFAALEALGLGKLMRKVPPSLRGKLTNLSVDYCLAMSYTFDLTPSDPREVVGPRGRARYFGVRLVPTSKAHEASTDGGEQRNTLDT